MAQQYIGSVIRVTLFEPPDSQVEGRVADIVDQHLTLADVVLKSSNTFVPQFELDSSSIKDLRIIGGPTSIQSQKQKQKQKPKPSSPVQQQQIATRPKPTAEDAFCDPAIVSFGRPSSDGSASLHKRQTTDLGRELLKNALRTSSTHSAVSSIPVVPSNNAGLSSRLTEPFQSFNIESDLKGNPAAYEEVPITESTNIKKEKTSGLVDASASARSNDERASVKSTAVQTNNAVARKNGKEAASMVSDSSPEVEKGWRKPSSFTRPSGIVQDGRASSTTLRRGKKRRQRKSRGAGSADPNGWATEEATDIQEAGDFDFAANLSKFDKKTVFEEIRKEDTTAEGERLVSFNKARKTTLPGTNGGKNLHYTEMVLSPPHSVHDSFDDTTDVSEASKSAKHSRYHRDSIKTSTSTIRGPSRRANDFASSADEHHGTRSTSRRGYVHDQNFSVGIRDVRGGSASGSRSRAASRRAPYDSEKMSTTSLRASQEWLATQQQQQPESKSKNNISFYFFETNKECPTFTPLQINELEQICINELGMSEDMLTENAARGIVEITMQTIKNILNARIVILAGNNRSGARAIAAGRHLLNHGALVTIGVLGLQRDFELIDGVKTQISIFRGARKDANEHNRRGIVVNADEMKALLDDRGDPCPSIVIDALLGTHLGLEDLRIEDQDASSELMSWVRWLGCPILSIEVPTGVNATQGSITPSQHSEGFALLPPHANLIILSFSAPKTGLAAFLAKQKVFGIESGWKFWVADIGICRSAWSMLGVGRAKGRVEFTRGFVERLVVKKGE